MQVRYALPLAFTALGCRDGSDEITGIDASAARRDGREFIQRERLGNPLVSEVMIVKVHHHEHNRGTPSTDAADFTDDLTTFITGTAGRSPAYPSAIAGVLLPDLLVTYPKRDGTPVFWLSWVFNGFGGRSLSDDVVDIGLGALFGNLSAITTVSRWG